MIKKFFSIKDAHLKAIFAIFPTTTLFQRVFTPSSEKEISSTPEGALKAKKNFKAPTGKSFNRSSTGLKFFNDFENFRPSCAQTKPCVSIFLGFGKPAHFNCKGQYKA
jgi:hypothetical protein